MLNKVLIFVLLGYLASFSKLTLEPLSISGSYEFGIYNSGIARGANDYLETNDLWNNTFGTSFAIQGRDDNFFFKAAFHGISLYPQLPIIGSTFETNQKSLFLFFPSILGSYHWDFGLVKLTLDFGSFGHKYSFSHNLGEYLFRSVAYPTILKSGGSFAIGSAGAALTGIRFKKELFLSFGDLSLESFLFTENIAPPLHDFSLAFMGKFKTRNKFFELFGGVNIKRLFVVDEDKTFHNTLNNTYVKVEIDDRPITLVGHSDYYDALISIQQSLNNIDSNKLNELILYDNISTEIFNGQNESTNISHHLDSLMNIATDTDSDYIISINSLDYKLKILDYGFYKNTALLLTSGMSFDFKSFLNYQYNQNDLKLYSEIAVLGVKNYPIFYDNIWNRIPVMVGFNIPTFGWLDVFSVEVEYFQPAHVNSTKNLGGIESGDFPFVAPPIPDYSSTVVQLFSESSFVDLALEDKIKWSFLLSKYFMEEHLKLQLQIAHDHQRLFSSWYSFGDHTSTIPITSRKKDWYWLVQLSFQY